MKNYKGIVLAIVLFCVNGLFAGMYIQVPITFDSILNGAIGQDYAAKAREINSSGVTWYVDALNKEVNAALNARYTDESVRINAIKLAINRNYNFLASYRKNNQAANLPPVVGGQGGVQQLSMDSILGGTLGDDYALKANAVYNSGVSVYVEALVRDVNRDINARYEDNSVRIRNIKMSIDRNYNFLMNYRKNN